MDLVPVILSYNHRELTQKCIASVLRHFPLGPIYLVHNGSQEQNIKSLQVEFPQVRHLVMDVNQGFSGGANHGLRVAFGAGAREILFLTNDTTLEHIHHESPRTSAYMLAPRIERRKTGTIDSLGGRVDLYKGKLIHYSHPGDADPVDPGFYIPGTAFVISKDAWERTGEFDAHLGTYWDDVDYSLRARAQGVHLGLIPSLIVHHGIGKTCHGNPLYTLYFYHRNRKRVTWRHAKISHRIVFCVMYAWDMTRKIVKFALNHDPIRLKFVLRALVS